MPKVSVIIPVYGVEKYIERCACSLFEQTLDEVECIFIDDCSLDRSMEVLETVVNRFPDKRKNIILLRNESNRGVLQTRLRGIKRAQGEYIIHCDADDWVEPQMYEKLYDEALRTAADIVWCDFHKSDGESHTVVRQKGADDPIKDILLSKRQGALWNHLVRRDIVRNCAIINPIRNMAEDMTLLLQYFMLAEKWAYINEPLYYYYQNTVSISSGETKEKLVSQAQQMGKNVNIFDEFLQKNGESEKWRDELIFRKFFNKRWLLPAVDSLKHCRYWLDCHPDINSSLYLNPYISKYEKIISLLVELRLYPLLRKLFRGR